MAQIAGLQDFRKHGAPADIGTFMQPATAIVFQFTFSGTTTIVAIAVGVSGWVLIDQGAVVATVINAALTAAGGADDGEVVVLAGAYNVLATLSVPESVLFRGVGWATIFNYDAGGNCITITGDNAKVRDLKVVIVAGAGEAGTRPNGIYATDRTNLEITKVWLIGDLTVGYDGTATRQNGIIIWTVTYTKIVNSVVENWENEGILLLLSSTHNEIEGNICSVCYDGIMGIGSSTYNTITGNIIHGCVADGIILILYNSDTPDYNTIVGNTITECTYGIELNDAYYNTVTGNTCQGNSSTGITIDSDFNTVTGNTCPGNDRGIFVRGVSNTITGNTCQGNTSEGIHLSSAGAPPCNDNTVTGNTCIGNGRIGILLYVTDTCTLTGNTCQGNTEHGIELDTSNNNTVVGNTCQGNTMHGILLDTSDNNTVVGNSCQGNTMHGILLDTSHNNTVVGSSCNGNDSGDTGTYDGISLTGSSVNIVLGNMCQANDRWGIMVDADSDFNKVSNNYTNGNTAGSIRVNNANCNRNQIEFNTVEEGAPGNVGTETRSYGNYDPSANAFVGDVGAVPF